MDLGWLRVPHHPVLFIERERLDLIQEPSCTFLPFNRLPRQGAPRLLEYLPDDRMSLNLIGPLKDLREFRITKHPLHVEVLHVPVPSRHLHRAGGDLHCRVTGKKFCHGSDLGIGDALCEFLLGSQASLIVRQSPLTHMIRLPTWTLNEIVTVNIRHLPFTYQFNFSYHILTQKIFSIL